MNTLTLCLLTPRFQKQPPPTLFKTQGWESERERGKERERFHAYSSTLSQQGPPARQLFLASPHTIFRPLPVFEAFIRKSVHQIKENDGSGGALFWPSNKIVFM